MPASIAGTGRISLTVRVRGALVPSGHGIRGEDPAGGAAARDRRTADQPEVEKAAYEVLPTLLPEPDEETPPASWVVLHRGADNGAYLLAYSWTWGNVVEARTLSAGQPTVGTPDENPAHFADIGKPFVGCVWELAVLEHERVAWVRHVLSPDEPDLDAWVADTAPEGQVGR
jgi:hypothetical protein